MQARQRVFSVPVHVASLFRPKPLPDESPSSFSTGSVMPFVSGLLFVQHVSEICLNLAACFHAPVRPCRHPNLTTLSCTVVKTNPDFPRVTNEDGHEVLPCPGLGHLVPVLTLEPWRQKGTKVRRGRAHADIKEERVVSPPGNRETVPLACSTKVSTVELRTFSRPPPNPVKP